VSEASNEGIQLTIQMRFHFYLVWIRKCDLELGTFALELIV